MAKQESCSRGFSFPNATFDEFRHGPANLAAKPKANGNSGRRVLHKVGNIIGIGASTRANCDKTNDGSFVANYPDGSSASHALPNSFGVGYTGHHQNDSVSVALYSKGIHAPKNATTVQRLQSPSPISNEHFAISQAGSYRTPYYNDPGHYNVSVEPSAANHVTHRAW